jgi:hypothetical protein
MLPVHWNCLRRFSGLLGVAEAGVVHSSKLRTGMVESTVLLVVLHFLILIQFFDIWSRFMNSRFYHGRILYLVNE